MWFWHELRIDATTDALAIKRAYAKRLKHTRPDDDAVAYQRLREAYEQALEWARHAVLAEGDDDDDEGDAFVETTESAAPDGDRFATAPRPDTHEPFAEAADARSVATDDGFGRTSPHHALGTDDNAPDSAPALGDVPLAHADDGFTGTSDDSDTAPADDDAGFDATHDDPASWITPDAIARALLAFRDEHGDDALVDLWPRVRDDLDTIPLSMRDHASDVMAQLVLAHPTLPSPVVEAFVRHFQWGTDFRSVRTMPQGRVRALMTHLRELGILRINDPDVLHRFRAVRQLEALRGRGRALRAQLLALLLPERVYERWRGLPAHVRRGLGIDAGAAGDIGRWLLIAAFMRTGLLAALLVWVFSFGSGLSTQQSITHGLFATLAVHLAAMLAPASRIPLDRLHAALQRRWTRLADPPGHWRFALAVAIAGSSGMLAPAASNAIGVPTSIVLWFAIAFAATVPIWSLRNPWLMALVPVTVVLHAALHATMPSFFPATMIASFALGWTLLALWVATRATDWVIAIYRNPFATFRPTTAWGWILWIVFFKGVLAFAALATVLSMPLTLMVQARGFGMRFACAGVAIAAAVTFVAHAHGDEMPALLPLVFVPILLALAQWLANLVAGSRPFR